MPGMADGEGNKDSSEAGEEIDLGEVGEEISS